jgi:hypothetical protein
VIQQILRCDPAAIGSAKQTALEVIGRPFIDQIRLEAVWGYALCAASKTVDERTREFFDKTDRGRAGETATPL